MARFIPQANYISFVWERSTCKASSLVEDKKELLASVHLIVANRAESKQTKSLSDQFLDIMKKLEIETRVTGDSSYSLIGLNKRAFLLDENFCLAQSTTLRSALESSGELPKGWMDPKVIEYIRENKLL